MTFLAPARQCCSGTERYHFQITTTAKAAWEQHRQDSGVETQTQGHSDEGKHESAQDDFAGWGWTSAWLTAKPGIQMSGVHSLTRDQ
jgi:hypothetical protein